MTSDRNAEQRAAHWLAAWDGQGIHRTATAGDQAGAEWLLAEAKALGVAAGFEEVSLARLDPVAAYLDIAGERIDAVPVFDAPATDAAGVEGRLGVDIAVAELTPRAVYSGEFERLRRAPGQRGFVVVCSGDAPGMGLLNAESFRRPYGAPAVHVASEVREAVLTAVARRAPCRLVADSRRTQASGRNVVATLPGSGRPLVVMTPRSSWWQSVAERGGGIVAWLESLRALVARPPQRPVVFTANCGHELGHLGLDAFIARRPGWDRSPAEGGATWVHYGANLGAAGGTLSVVSPHGDLRALAAAELGPEVLARKDLVPSGETRDIQRAGGHCLAFHGTNRLFHLPQDRWPDAVDVAAIARIAAAGARLVTALAG